MVIFCLRFAQLSFDFADLKGDRTLAEESFLKYLEFYKL